MRAPSESDLKERARVLVQHMARVGRIVYAIPATVARTELHDAIRAAGLIERETDGEGAVTRFTDETGDDTLVALDRDDLGVRIFEARGQTVAQRVRVVLERVPFVPQTHLLREALDVGSPDARKALTILAHGAVAWDDDWTDLFLLHLASPDPISRSDAVSSTFLAAMVSGAHREATMLLREAHAREKFPKLRETIEDAVRRLDGVAIGNPDQ